MFRSTICKAFFQGTISIAIVFLSTSFVFSQISLNGTVDRIDFEGLQPELIQGVSSVPASGRPLVRHVYLAAPDVLAIIFDEKACILSNLKPFRKEKGDTIVMGGYHGLTKLYVRKGDTLGYVNGRSNKWYRPFNEIAGEALDLKWASNPQNFVISSPDDPGYSKGVHPVEISRKSVPDENAGRLRISSIPLFTLRHYIYLRLPLDFTSGKRYRVSFNNYNGGMQKGVSFRFDDDELRSEAIHVNLYGYAPEDKKIAFLSAWMGDGGALLYPEGLQFRIISINNNRTVYTGRVKLKQSARESEYEIDGERFNHNKTHVYEMDFSPLSEKGNYKLVIDGIGCSFDFLIDDDVWENITKLLMKGFFHQRAGIELGPPYTDYIRPRNLHPADGHEIHKCDPDKFFGAPRGHFASFQAGILEETSISEAWGGWMDAGDFDRRMKHHYSVRRMMYLCELNPEYFERVQFNIPESPNGIPDILDEALWCLDLFRRTQGIYEEGAVSWWIESIEHPREGEASWTNSLPTALAPPTPEACIDYAGTAAYMALLLKKYDETLASEYEKSALDAIAWVEKNPNTAFVFIRKDRREVIESYAYINLYRLTGEKLWHRRFLEKMEVMYPEGIDGHLTIDWIAPNVDGFHSFGWIDPVTVYALMNPSKVNNKLQADCRAAIVTLANELLKGAENTYGVFRLKGHPVSHLVTMSSKILPVAMAHEITKEPRYRDALAMAVQYTMGLNPMNRSYVSGLGERSFVPYHHDWHTDNLPIPAGLPNFGPMLQYEDSWGWSSQAVLESLARGGLYPATLLDWPMSEKCFNQMWYPPVNEFMVQSPMGELLMLTGYLASHQ